MSRWPWLFASLPGRLLKDVVSFMPLRLSRQYLVFYLEGRRASGEAFAPTIDLDLVAERILDKGETPYQALLETVANAAKSLDAGPRREAWIHRHRFKLYGLDAELAYRHFIQGLIDDTVSEFDADEEDGILAALEDVLADDDDNHVLDADEIDAGGDLGLAHEGEF